MPKYFYTAKSADTKQNVSGTIEASNENELAKFLREDNLFLIEAKEKKEKKRKNVFSISFLDKVSLVDKIFFTRNLQVMLSGGLSFPRALDILALQIKNKKFKNALIDIKEEINKGNSFSSSLEKYPNIFSETFRSMIQLSEETGEIEKNLKIIINQLEKEHELKSRITGALIYPAVILCAMFGIGILMLVVILPQLASIFESMEVDLPITTQLIINFGEFLSNNGLLLIFFSFFSFFIIKFSLKTKKGKKIIDYLLLKIPFVSSIIKKTNSAHTARTLSSLLSSGVPIVKGLDIISRNLSNIYYKESIINSIDEMKKGGKLSQALAPYSNLYSLLVIQMIEVGEETGQTAKVLSKMSDFLEDEVFNLTKNLSSVIEPILMIVIGAAVGFFAVSMLQPIYSMMGGL